MRESWKIEVNGTRMFTLVTKLKRLKYAFLKLNKDNFSDIEKKHADSRGQAP